MGPYLTDDELRHEHDRARKLADLCHKHGFPQCQSHYRFLAEACEAEAKERRIDL